MYEKFPKKSRATGEQKSCSFLAKSTSPEYTLGTTASKHSIPGKGASSRHQSRTIARGAFASAGGLAQVSATYPAKKGGKFSFPTAGGPGSVPKAPFSKPKAW